MTRNNLLVPVLVVLALGGCASTANIDLSKVESTCGQTCSKNYSDCMGQFSVFPIRLYNACAEGLRLCSQSCPARQPLAPALAASAP